MLPACDYWSARAARNEHALLQNPGRFDRPTAGYSTPAAKVSTSANFSTPTGGNALDKLRQLPDYRAVVPRQQHDAEVGLARVMIRTGKED